MAAVFILLTAVISISCSDKSTSPSRRSTLYFPNVVGSGWSYAVIDEITGDEFTVDIFIADSTTMAGGLPVSMWEYDYPDSRYTEYVGVKDDTVRFFGQVSDTASFRIYCLPFEVGNIWPGQNIVNDTFEVVGRETVTTEAGEFNDSYKVVQRWHIFENMGTITRWFVPNVGMVKMNRRGLSAGRHHNQTWSLRYFYLLK